MRERFFGIVGGQGTERAGRVFDISIIALILLNCVAMALETNESLHVAHARFFELFETISVVIFTVEYVLRVWTCVENGRFRSPITGRMRYMVGPMAIVDLLAILPFYLASLGVDLRIIRILRIFRVFRVLKLGRYSESVRILGVVLGERKADLFTTMFVGLILMVLSSYAVYLVEHPVQPEAFGTVLSGVWWSVAVLTPGPSAYQFAQPMTLAGKALAVLTQLFGVGIIALPTGILGAGFTAALKEHRQKAAEKSDTDGGEEGVTEADDAGGRKICDIVSRLERIEEKLDALGRNPPDP